MVKLVFLILPIINKAIMNLSMQIKLSNWSQKLGFLLLIFLYRICLDEIYKQCISPFWGYYNLTYEPVEWLITFSWIMLFVFSLVVYPFFDRPNSVVSIAAILFFFIRYVPLTSFLAGKAQDVNFVILECIYWGLLFFFLRVKNRISVYRFHKNDILINVITVILVTTIIFVSGYYAHFRMNFSLENVYDLRAEARGFDMPIILSYLWLSASNVLPIILIYFIQKDKILIASLVFFVVFLNFSINGSKATLFKLFFCLFLYFFMKKELLKRIPFLFVLLASSALLEWKLFDTNWISNVVIRRVLFIPSLMDSLYFDYIEQYGVLYFNMGTNNINFLIGEEYFNSSDMRANNGMFTDAYMNLGWLGCLVYPLLYSIFLKICDSAFENVNKQIVFFATLLIVTTLGSSLFSTALLTHGILLLCFVVSLLPRSVNRNLNTIRK